MASLLNFRTKKSIQDVENALRGRSGGDPGDSYEEGYGYVEPLLPETSPKTIVIPASIPVGADLTENLENYVNYGAEATPTTPVASLEDTPESGNAQDHSAWYYLFNPSTWDNKPEEYTYIGDTALPDGPMYSTEAEARSANILENVAKGIGAVAASPYLAYKAFTGDTSEKDTVEEQETPSTERILMQDQKTWRDRNFMDNAFDILRKVDEYIDPAQKYFNESMREASLSPFGYVSANRDTSGPVAAAIQGVNMQRALGLKERGKGDAVNTMFYDISNHVRENYPDLTPEEQRNEVLKLAENVLPYYKARQTQFNLGSDKMQDFKWDLFTKDILQQQQANNELKKEAITTYLEPFAVAHKASPDNQLKLSNLLAGIKASGQTPGYFGGGKFLDATKRTFEFLGLSPRGSTLRAVVDNANVQQFSTVMDQVNKGALSNAEGNKIDRVIPGLAGPVEQAVAMSTLGAMAIKYKIEYGKIYTLASMAGLEGVKVADGLVDKLNESYRAAVNKFLDYAPSLKGTNMSVNITVTDRDGQSRIIPFNAELFLGGITAGV